MKLQAFFYLLMRDKLPAGVVESLVAEAESPMKRGNTPVFSNKPLAEYAAELAGRLQGSATFELVTPRLVEPIGKEMFMVDPWSGAAQRTYLVVNGEELPPELDSIFRAGLTMLGDDFLKKIEISRVKL